jgi:hypothetical protein
MFIIRGGGLKMTDEEFGGKGKINNPPMGWWAETRPLSKKESVERRCSTCDNRVQSSQYKGKYYCLWAEALLLYPDSTTDCKGYKSIPKEEGGEP